MRLLGIAAVALALAGCGGTKKSFDESFDKSFHESFVKSCVDSAVKAGAPQAAATTLCSCTSDKIKDKYSTKEKMALKNEQILPLAEACRAEHPN
jgi:hypothetical protein